MKRTTRTRRIFLVATLLILAAAAGVLTAMLGAGGRLSYTELPPNPSVNPNAQNRSLRITPPHRRPMPKEFTFTDGAGRAQHLAELKGRVILVNLWATWCPPCVAEMPDLDALQGQLGGDSFQVVAVSLDRGGKAIVERWFAKAGIRNLAIHNTNPADFPDFLLPTSILLDRHGRVAWTGAGIYAWTEGEALDAIKAVIAESEG